MPNLKKNISFYPNPYPSIPPTFPTMYHSPLNIIINSWCTTWYVYLHIFQICGHFRVEEEEESKWKKRCLYCIDLFCWWDCCWPWVKFAKAIEWFIMDAFIDLFITLCIVVNTIFMALDHNSMSLEFERTLKTGNYVSFCATTALQQQQQFFAVLLITTFRYHNHAIITIHQLYQNEIYGTGL